MADFYTSKNDSQLAKDIISDSTDMYIMENETPASDSGVFVTTVPAAAVLTPLVSPAWTIDALIGQLVVIQDKNGNAQEFIVADNTATSLTVDTTSDVDAVDKSSLFVNGDTYSYTLWGTEQFIGYTDESSFTDEEEVKQFKTGVPRKKVREDLLEKTASLETTIRTVGAGILKAVYNLKDESTATYYILKGGSNPGSNRGFYYVILKNNTVDAKAQQLRLYWCQLNANGARTLGGGDDYETIPCRISISASPLHDVAEDFYRVRITK